MRALAASAATYTEEKIHVLGRALANGVLTEDDAILDTELFVVDAFSRLEAPHVRVLELLSKAGPVDANAVKYRLADPPLTVAAISGAYPQAGPTLPAIVATLEAVGAIIEPPLEGLTFGQTASYQASDFGELLLERLREAGRAWE